MRQHNKLTDESVASAVRPGKYGDGRGLYLIVRASGARDWVFFYSFGGKRREMKLFSAFDFHLTEARREVSKHHREISKARDPLDKRRARSQQNRPARATFGKTAEHFLAIHEPTWPNANHRRQWRSSLTTHCAPIWEKPIGAIKPKEIVEILSPIWLSTPESARKLRHRIASVFNFAQASGLCRGENPARREGNLEFLLPRQPRQSGHYESMPFEDLPGFMTELSAATPRAARPLEFLILTAMRTKEVLGARWEEIDLQSKVWIVPAERMKANVEHRVPLSTPAIALLKRMADAAPATGLIFPGLKPGKPLSDMVMIMFLRRRGIPFDAHGFRSTFKDWASEETEYPDWLSEQALAHQVGSKVRRAYRRRDALEKRRALMQDWGRFCCPTDPDSATDRLMPI